MAPVSQLVRDRKSFASVRAAQIDSNNGRIVATDDPRLATVEWSAADARADVKRNGVEVDLVGVRDPQLLQKTRKRHDMNTATVLAPSE